MHDNDKSSEDKSLSEENRQVPVPKSMRTRRALPRLVALCIVIAWVFTFAVASQSLTRKEHLTNTLLDQFLQDGTKHWGIKLSEQCVGYLQINLSKETTPLIKLKSVFQVSLFEQAVLVKSHGEVMFSPDKRLQTVSAVASLGEMVIELRSRKDNEGVIDIMLENGPTKRSFAAERPDPTVLLEKGPGRYSIKFPTSIQTLLINLSSSSKKTLFSIRQLDETSVATCRNQARNLEQHKTQTLLELKTLLQLVFQKPEAEIFHELGLRPHDSTP